MTFNGWMQDEVRDETSFRNLTHVHNLITEKVTDDNTPRPDFALCYQSPAGFVLRLTAAIARPGCKRREFRAPKP